MAKVPRAPAYKHIAAFKRAGWVVDHVEGSYYILVKRGARKHLSIPMHKGKDLPIGLLRGLLRDAGLTVEEYIAFFYKRKHSPSPPSEGNPSPGSCRKASDRQYGCRS